MAPPPPPSVNLLRALRALTAVRPVIPTPTRRSLSYKPATTHTSISAREYVFHRNLHLPRAIHGNLQVHNTSHNQFRFPIPTPPKLPCKPTPILPSPHLLARRFHAATPLSDASSSPPPKGGLANASSAPKNLDRGPISSESTQTNFNTMDILSSTPPPTSSIDACLSSGFHLSNGIKLHKSGVLIVSGEAFAWRPWGRIGLNLLNAQGQWDGGGEAGWGLLELVWPKPDLLILGLGPRMFPLAEGLRAYLNGLGVRVEVQDTRNAAAQFNLLATERGVGSVAAALVPVGWIEGRGC